MADTPETERDTLPPEEPHPCWQQELRSAVAKTTDVVGRILNNLSSLTGNVSDLAVSLVRVGHAVDRALSEPKEQSDVTDSDG